MYLNYLNNTKGRFFNVKIITESYIFKFDIKLHTLESLEKDIAKMGHKLTKLNLHINIFLDICESFQIHIFL